MEEVSASEREKRVSTTLIGVYTMGLTVLSAIFPFVFVLTGKKPKESIYMQVLCLYTSIGSCIFLTYACIRIYLHKRYNTLTEFQEVEITPERPVDTNETCLDKARPCERGTLQEPCCLSVCHGNPLLPTQAGRGVNLFMRVGMLAFGLCTVLRESFRVAAYSENPDIQTCFGLSFLVIGVLNFITLMLQMYFLFKYYNIRVNGWTMRLGVAHLITFNVAYWFFTVISTASDGIDQTPGINHNDSSSPDREAVADFKHLGCVRGRVIADLAGRYLYPVVIGYRMLSVALLLRIYIHSGKRQPASSCHAVPVELIKCRANSGLYLGLTLLMLTFSSISIFYHYNKKTKSVEFESVQQGAIYLTTTLFVNSLALATLVPAFPLVMALKVVKKSLEYQLNDVLLFTMLCGHYFLLVFMIFPCASTWYSPNSGYPVKVLGFIAFLLDLIQSTLQVWFIMAGMRRQTTRNGRAVKAGRALVTFLFFCNLCTWSINSMELKESYNSVFFNGYYGNTTWVIILSIFLPMSLFFRFHSSICLSEIWLYTYK